VQYLKNTYLLTYILNDKLGLKLLQLFLQKTAGEVEAGMPANTVCKLKTITPHTENKTRIF